MVYRSFCRVVHGKSASDAKTLVRLGQVIGAETIAELQEIESWPLAQERGVIQGRRMRADTTVVESNVHYPTDSGLLSDGARVLTRAMKKIASKSGVVETQGPRSNPERAQASHGHCPGIAPPRRGGGTETATRVSTTAALDAPDSPTIRKGCWGEVEATSARRRRAVQGLREELEMMANRVRRVVRQTRARVLEGITQFPDNSLSLFETHTEVIRKGKAAKPNDLGNVVEFQEAENQIITHYEVFEKAHQRSVLAVASDRSPPAQTGASSRMGCRRRWILFSSRMKKRPKPWE